MLEALFALAQALEDKANESGRPEDWEIVREVDRMIVPEQDKTPLWYDDNGNFRFVKG